MYKRLVSKFSIAVRTTNIELELKRLRGPVASDNSRDTASLTGVTNPETFLPIVGLFPLKHGNTVWMVPIRGADSPTAMRFAPPPDLLKSWATDPSLKWKVVFREEAFWRRCNLDCPRGAFFRQLPSYIAKIQLREFRSPAFPLLTRCRDVDSVTSGSAKYYPERGPDDTVRRRAMMALASRDPEVAPIFHTIESAGDYSSHPPYGDSASISQFASPATPKQRSVAFINFSYYNGQYLAKALRARGWDAVSITTKDPNGPDAMFGHGGEDLVLFDSDPLRQMNLMHDAYQMISQRFGILHFYGVGTLSIFPQNHDQDNLITHDRIPWDVLDAKRRGIKIGYSHSGCLDAVSQSSFREWNGRMCSLCPWELRPNVCSDERNLSWGWKVATLVDLFCIETEVMLDFKNGNNVFREPLTFALDPEVWSASSIIGAQPLRTEEGSEIKIHHAVGNFESRLREGRNVKGTTAVVEAVRKLQAEGLAVRLVPQRAASSKDNVIEMAKADIVVDQLNYGRYGATAREGMMLGKPVVGRVEKMEPYGIKSECIEETPIVHADEGTIYVVLRELVRSAERRREIGARSRAHALKWWSADVLAGRYESVTDRLFHGKPQQVS